MYNLFYIFNLLRRHKNLSKGEYKGKAKLKKTRKEQDITRPNGTPISVARKTRLKKTQF